MTALCFNIRTDEQPNGGFSVVVVFEPQPTEFEALKQANLIADCFREDLGWECGRSQ
jgi:hypothetical protein